MTTQVTSIALPRTAFDRRERGPIVIRGRHGSPGVARR